MDIIQIIINAGSVGIAVYCLYILEKIEGNHLSHLRDTIDKNTEVLNKLENSIIQLIDFLEGRLGK